MQILHIRNNGSLLSQLAAEEERRQQIVRLRSDKPNDVQILHRSKLAEFDLKQEYPRRVLQSVAAAAVLIGGVFFYNPEKVLPLPEYFPNISFHIPPVLVKVVDCSWKPPISVLSSILKVSFSF